MKEKKFNIIKFLKKIILLAGLVIVSFYGADFFLGQKYIVGIWQYAFIAVYFFLLQLIVLKVTARKKREIKITKWPVIFALVTALTIIFYSRMMISFPQEEIGVKIVATGEKNEKAQAAEIWIKSIKVDDESVNLETIWHDNVWQYNQEANTLVASPQDEMSEIQFSCKDAGLITIEFYKHEWSGIVEISDTNGNNDRIDLYDSESGEETYYLSIPKITTNFQRIESVIGTWIVWTEILTCFWIWNKKYSVTKTGKKV